MKLVLIILFIPDLDISVCLFQREFCHQSHANCHW
jgi:hypothetical protein